MFVTVWKIAEVSFEVDGFSSKIGKGTGANVTQSREPLAMKTNNFRRGKIEENIPHKAFEQ